MNQIHHCKSLSYEQVTQSNTRLKDKMLNSQHGQLLKKEEEE